MKALPPILVIADRGHLVAYRIGEDESLSAISTEEFAEGNQKISDVVTDQAGSFHNPGSSGVSSGESLPLVAELEVRSLRRIGETIRSLITREKVTRWGLVAPSEINGAILDHVGKLHAELVSFNLKRDLVNVPKNQLLGHLRKAQAAA